MSRGGHLEILAVGDELLLGDSVDTNGTWLGRRLSELGLLVARRTVVGDDDGAIREALAGALGRSGAVICTGGLGPTPDDLTRDAVARLYDRPLEPDAAWLGVVRERFRRRDLEMPDINRRQALRPRGAVLFPNPAGTAPGLAIDDPALGLTVLLPGPPREMQALFEAHVAGYLTSRLGGRRRAIVRRTLRTTGLAESRVAELVADLVPALAPLAIAFIPVGIGVDLRVSSRGEMEAEEAGPVVDAALRRLADRLGDAVYGEGDVDLAAVVGEALARSGLTVATAESCTGGLVAKRLTDVPGASAWVLSAIVTYSDSSKQELLGVPPPVLAEHGAVSEAVARAMLDGVRAVSGADCAMAITGVAGPGGGTPDKPVGTVWVAAAVRDRAQAGRYQFVGDRSQVRERSAQAALAMLLGMLRANS